jgi:transposase
MATEADTRQDGRPSIAGFMVAPKSGGDIMNSSFSERVRHLYEVEGLSIRQIASTLAISRKKVSRIINNEAIPKAPHPSILQPYERLIEVWYKTYPSLKATQVYDRLREYGFSGCYGTVKLYTRKLRKKNKGWFHELEFLPAEEAQVDWMEYHFPFGLYYGFVFILAYSRYLFLQFYPRYSLEFFLDGHIQAFKEIQGVARRNRYDNLKSVVIRRSPELTFNAQFLDFATHYGFSIYPCTPGRANEKGRVERVIRDIKDFLRSHIFENFQQMKSKVNLWRRERNHRIHRSTGNTPLNALQEEPLKPLPQIHYQPYRVILAKTSTTGFVEFDTNRYSVPSRFSDSSCEIYAYPDHIEVFVQNNKVATHQRVFERKQKIEHPSHRHRLLQISPNFKAQRIYQLMKGMDQSVALFLHGAESDGESSMEVAYQLFKLLTQSSKSIFLSAVREAISVKSYKIRYLQSLLCPHQAQSVHPVHPQNPHLLSLTYEGRSLHDYDELL